ncbi:MAG: family 20 glycosylhydrolase [Crocinitomicaceae bacterium]|nr:family 20 glycosylhydrolase [Crocinitomicaceae bacterium]
MIPEPVLLEKREGSFKISNDTYFSYSNELLNEGIYLANLIDSASDFSLKKNLEAKVKSSEIELKIVNDFPAELQHGEAYRLIISPEKMQITALSSTGIMRGIQTVRQLFIPAFHSGEKRQAWFLPCLKIEDKPAFEHRGLMMDVCRHFFEKEVVFKYIDLLAFYKMNILHLHLTEDQGWRIQIDQYPKLNEIASYRTEKDGSVYGGYYSKEDLKEIVAYAKERHIVVIPEIELPGHAQAALAAYPQYSCNGGPIEVVNEWGVFKEIYCAGNDSTFIFIETILLEVMEIFPSEYIHIGGDEAPKFRWENCSKCQQRMKDENLADEHELQSYFIKRIEKFLNNHGRKLIGWDEILEGGLSENATVQSWRGMDGGKLAAEQKHYVVMSPTSHCYLDYGLDAIDLKKIYSFDPLPENLASEFYKYILGAECNIWTEHVPDENILDSKVFPRMIGLAEVLWSGPDTSRYDDFYNRLQKHYPILDLLGVQSGMESIPVFIETVCEDQEVFIEITQNIKNLDLKYRWICDNCDTTLLPIPERMNLDKSGILEIHSIKNGKSFGMPVEQKFSNHAVLFSPSSYANEFNQWYPAAGTFALTDGKMGSHNFRDGNWQGFWGEDLDVVLSLGEKKRISKITMHFLEYVNAWIMKPAEINISFSEDGKDFKQVVNQKIIPVNVAAKDNITINPYLISFDPCDAQYLRIQAENFGKLPASHEAAGQDAWLFIDEIIAE